MNPLTGVLREAWATYKTYAAHFLLIAFVSNFARHQWMARGLAAAAAAARPGSELGRL